ncbi:MAG: hypothetical protein ISR65_08210 [Bacteriovoracaceae bacterium]|nr:hypothetical protein [Bacteriovoracaceae bacterium]
MQSVGISSMASILYDASYEVETESNWQNFKTAIPANLKFVEGLLYLEPENRKLLATLTKGYSAYAFVVNDTLYLRDYFKDVENSFNKQQSIYNYSKAIEHGMHFLQTYGINYITLTRKMKENNGIMELLSDKLGRDDQFAIEGMFALSQALIGLINHQRNRVHLVAQLPIAKGLLDWSCNLRPNLNLGACNMLYGAYESSRPRILGGNPEKGKQYFLKFINEYPNNPLARLSFIQYYLIPMSDEQQYRQQAYLLEQNLRDFKKRLTWDPTHKNRHSKAKIQSNRTELYGSIVLERFAIIKEFEKQLF